MRKKLEKMRTNLNRSETKSIHKFHLPFNKLSLRHHHKTRIHSQMENCAWGWLWNKLGWAEIFFRFGFSFEEKKFTPSRKSSKKLLDCSVVLMLH
jgi:hypothetical protein